MNYQDSENDDEYDSQEGLRWNRNYIEDSRRTHGLNIGSNERRSYDERRSHTMDDNFEERLSDRSERRLNEWRSHPEHRQGHKDRRSEEHINDDEARGMVLDNRYIQQLEEEIAELKNMNKKLKAQVSEFRNSRSRSSKRNIRRDNEWTAEEGRLADKIVPFCKLYLFPRYKFLKDNWMDYDLEHENSFCNFVVEKINEMYPNMRIITRSKREWESVYVPLIGQKYSNMRCNLSNDFRSQYFGKFTIHISYDYQIESDIKYTIEFAFQHR